MKNNKKPSLLIVLFIFLAISISCYILLSRPTTCESPNAPVEFPDRDIIFQTYPHDMSDKGENTLGFVNADGSGLVYLDTVFLLPVFGRCIEIAPMQPIITVDGSILVYRNPRVGAGYLYIQHSGGPPIKCDDDISFGINRPQIEGDQIFTDTAGEMALFSIEDCAPNIPKDQLTIFTSPNTGYGLYSGSISPDRERIAFSARMADEGNYYILLYDTKSQETVRITEGDAPAWSPDGTSLAFSKSDGIYLMDMAMEIRLIVPYEYPSSPRTWLLLPSWSPDSQWLVYHKCTAQSDSNSYCGSIDDYSIFKVNVETGEEIKIIDGGLNPYWRK